MQPDLSKTGGITESMRIAAMASANKLTINPHTSATAINMGTTINFLSAIDNPGYFEGDVTSLNLFRDEMMDKPAYELDADGFVKPYEGVGIGMTINLDFVKDHPLIDGPCYV
jgi:D-galactarolactone cycloisomerase